MRFSLFKSLSFEVKEPAALIEAYCFQSDFYGSYDLPLSQGDRGLDYVSLIGARIKENSLEACKRIIEKHADFAMFDKSMTLDTFLKRDEAIDSLTSELGKIAQELDRVEGVGLSKATKILHTRYPEMIPMIDNPLQQEYKTLKGHKWKKEDWGQLFKDYYENFLPIKGETYDNLCRIHKEVSLLHLTKVRIFDILWWSCLKAKNLQKKARSYSKEFAWKTISLPK